MTGEVVRFPGSRAALTPQEAKYAAERALSVPPADRAVQVSELGLDDPETLLVICEVLTSTMESSPATVAEDAANLYRIVEKIDVPRSKFLFDERDYYLGEFAFLAGSACRFQSRREEARSWFSRAEAWFLLTSNSAGDLARLAYQKLALKMEEREYEDVLRLSQPVAEAFRRQSAHESVLKCRFLQAASLREMGRLDDALGIFAEIAKESRRIGSDRLLGLASVAIVQIYSDLGATQEAVREIANATPILRRLDNRVGLAKLHWGIANLLKQQGELAGSVERFRAAQQDFAELGMRADVAALHLVIADLLLESGQEAQAEWEIRAALPVIDELKMVPEGVAALSLLRESVRRRKIDRQALRDLHGYFDEIQG